MEELRKLIGLVARYKFAAILLTAILIAVWVIFSSGGLKGISVSLGIIPADKPQPSVSQNVTPGTSRQTSGERTSLRLDELHVSPVRFLTANYLYFRVANADYAVARSMRITIDFGIAKVLTKEIRQSSLCQFRSSGSDSVIVAECAEVPKSGYIDFGFVSTEPGFRRIHVEAANADIPVNEEYSFSESGPSSSENLLIYVQRHFPVFFNFAEFLFSILVLICVGTPVVLFFNWLARRANARAK